MLLNISVGGLEFSPGSAIRLKATIGNTGTEEVLLEYFISQLFEVIIRDESGTLVYVHSDRGFQRYLAIAPLHLGLAPEESHTETVEVPLVYSRGAEKGKPLPPGNYTPTVYLIATEHHPKSLRRSVVVCVVCLARRLKRLQSLKNNNLQLSVVSDV